MYGCLWHPTFNGMKKLFARVRNFFLPHSENAYHPHFFKKNTVTALAAVIVFLNIVYLVHTTVIAGNTGFLAAVLPGVLTSLTNNDRVAVGLSTLTESELLKKAAALKAEDMAKRGYFAHVAPDGTTPWHWIETVRYSYTYAGENLAVKFTDSKDVEEAWMKSPTHKANIVKPQFKEIGIATAQGMYKGEEVTFIVQYFATPSKKGITGVSKGKTVTASSSKTATSAPQVLGAEIEPAASQKETPIKDAVLIAASSPNHIMLYVLGGIFGAVALLLFLAIVIKIRVQYLEVIGAGIFLLALAGSSLFFFQETHIENVSLPADGASTVSVEL